MAKKLQRYSDEFKTEIVRKVVIDLQPVVQLAREHHIDPSTIRAWVMKSDMSRTNESPHLNDVDALSDTELRREMRLIQRENARLQMELEIIKKAVDIISRTPQ